ncbi:hypothetical protein F2Q70_00043921 [Brassica cretica]|uniref:Secreted protein n=1 Tax=Brassica cretica TaxID=69181 RepID=A0A8S9KNR4_BRACR|nr:hypothetical protein F2Q70_00043921 [Brassica cretica]
MVHALVSLSLSLATSAEIDIDDTKGNSSRGDRRKRVAKGNVNVGEDDECSSPPEVHHDVLNQKRCMM